MESTESMSLLTTPPPSEPVAPAKRRRRRGPVPRFKPDTTRQMNAVAGTPALQVPADHVAWRLRRIIEGLDTSAMEARYSSLGRHGYHPKRMLAVWTYASAIGIHHASRIERAMVTDAAFLLLSGGSVISAETLNRFRREFADDAPELQVQVLKLAVQAGLVKTDELAMDSVRLEADAARSGLRRLEDAEKRVTELEKTEPTLEVMRELAEHRETIDACLTSGRRNVMATCGSASFLSFPRDQLRPGVRASVAVSGVRSRFVVALLIDAASSDYGKIEPLLVATRKALYAAGIGEDTPLQVAADAGYFSETDLACALRERGRTDILIPEPKASYPGKDGKYFGRKHFTVDLDAMTAACPAGARMMGPYNDKEGVRAWYGVGCDKCPLRSKCTGSERRKFTIRPEFEKLRIAMRERMARPDAAPRYTQRMATVEPVFAYIEDVMGFRRLSSRRAKTIQSEIHLKVFAYNLLRVLCRARSFRVLVEVVHTGDALSFRLGAPATTS